MKKYVTFLLAVCLIFSLSACGGNEPVSTPDTESFVVDDTVITTTTAGDADKTQTPDSTTAATTTTGKQDAPQTTTTNKTPTTTGTTAHVHEYTEANCFAPATCSCGATKGSALSHSYAAATCTKPETCVHCGSTRGNALGHQYSGGACTACKMRAPSVGFSTTGGSGGNLVSGIGSCKDEHLVIAKESGLVGVNPRAFERNKTIKSVIFTEGITQIRYDAFTDCTSLTYVVIPASMNQVQYNAFYNCTALTDIYCAGDAPAALWDETWKQGCNAKVHWAGTWEFVNGEPVATR